MNIFILTQGAHGFTTMNVPPGAHAAHVFDPDSNEDVPHQAHHFIKNLEARGPSEQPLVVTAAYHPSVETEEQLLEVQMADWKSIVESGTGQEVEIR